MKTGEIEKRIKDLEKDVYKLNNPFKYKVLQRVYYVIGKHGNKECGCYRVIIIGREISSTIDYPDVHSDKYKIEHHNMYEIMGDRNESYHVYESDLYKEVPDFIKQANIAIEDNMSDILKEE